MLLEILLVAERLVARGAGNCLGAVGGKVALISAGLPKPVGIYTLTYIFGDIFGLYEISDIF